MTDSPLQGLHIINTRPKHQAGNWSTQLRILGATVSDLPAIEIEATARKWLSNVLPLTQFEQIIFVSANAVDCFFFALEATSKLSDKTKISAVGKQTAKQLEKFSIKALYPTIAGSEHLVTMPHLQKQTVNQKNILIVKGVGGRRLIARTLTQHGAKVKWANVYRRCCPNPSNNLAQLWQDRKERIILVTSRTAIDHLFQMMPNFQQQLQQATWLTLSRRIATYAQRKGVKHIIISDGEQNLIKSLSENCLNVKILENSQI